MTRCIDPDHGIGDHRCADVERMLAVQFPVDVARVVYAALETHAEQLDSFDHTPERMVDVAGCDIALNILFTAFDRAGVPVAIATPDLTNLESAIASLQAHIESLPADSPGLPALNYSLANLIDTYREQTGDPHASFGG